MVRTLLAWPTNAPMADCQDNGPLLSSAERGYDGIVRLLLAWPQPHYVSLSQYAVLALARQQDAVERALRLASEHKHKAVVRVLEAWLRSSREGKVPAAGAGAAVQPPPPSSSSNAAPHLIPLPLAAKAMKYN